ncbi:MAG: response regulator [Syntrophomonadaceae bacterium]|nr:response regulator [Syntrophomonadaceae bacterium]MDD3024250.1 response regulator [Syntrophomonadaceae bacterium]
MKAVLIDDEYYALQGLKMVFEEIGGIEIAGMFEDVFEALAAMEAINPEIIFLDIEMPELDGIKAFNRILASHPAVNIVFVTAYNHYAVQAFELNALDYVIKPVKKERLAKTLERIKPLIGQTSSAKRITINCFGRLSVLVDGQEINVGWRTKKAEELIAYLLCEKGRFVNKEKIAEALWPELDGEKSVANLYLAYYYLKKQEKKYGLLLPIESTRGKMRVLLEEVECDMVAFEHRLQSCYHIEDENIELAENAAKLYQGMLLQNNYYSWALDNQQYYELAYLELLRRIIAYYAKIGNISKQRIYEKMLLNKID